MGIYDRIGYGYGDYSDDYSMLLAMRPPDYLSHNQVFKKSQLLPLVKRIVDLKSRGQPAVLHAKLEVQEKKWWGITGGRDVEIILIYLEEVRDFEESLPSDTRSELKMGENGQFSSFPIYETAIGNLRSCQVNLLAAQGEYSVHQFETELTKFCTSHTISLRASPSSSKGRDSPTCSGVSTTTSL